MDDRADELGRLIAELRRPIDPDPDAVAAVKRAVAAERRPPSRRWIGWWLEPRPIRVSPLRLLGGAAGFAVLLIGLGRALPDGTPAADPPRAVAEGRYRMVEFVFLAHDAEEVSLLGDFNDWVPGATQLRPSAGGVWSVTIPLEPGRYTYSFVVDGRVWHSDPSAAPSAGEDFGRPSSVLLVSEAQS